MQVIPLIHMATEWSFSVSKILEHVFHALKTTSLQSMSLKAVLCMLDEMASNEPSCSGWLVVNPAWTLLVGLVRLWHVGVIRVYKPVASFLLVSTFVSNCWCMKALKTPPSLYRVKRTRKGKPQRVLYSAVTPKTISFQLPN